MKMLEGYTQNPELPRLISTSMTGRKTKTTTTSDKSSVLRCSPSSPVRQSPDLGYELVPKAVNRSKMDRACGVHLQLLAESQNVAIDTST
jgi:hypothetical protein